MNYPKKKDLLTIGDMETSLKNYLYKKDLDGDGVPNVKDCAPLNKNRQDFNLKEKYSKVKQYLKEKKQERSEKIKQARSEKIERLKDEVEIARLESKRDKYGGGKKRGFSFGGYSIGLNNQSAFDYQTPTLFGNNRSPSPSKGHKRHKKRRKK